MKKDYPIHKLLIKPAEKIADTLKHYAKVLNPLAANGNGDNEEERKSTINVQKHHDITWIDVENPKRKDITELAKEYDFHPLHVEACLLRSQLDRVEKEDKYLFILLHSPTYSADQDKVITNKVCFFLGKNYLITIHGDSPLIISDLFKACETDKEQSDAFFKKSPGFLLYNILDGLIKDTGSLRKVILQEVDEIEDIVFDVKVSGVYKISQLRQKVIRSRRIIGSFRKTMQELAADQSDFTSGMTRYYKSIANEADKLWDTMEDARETIEIYKDADFTVSTEKTNKILTVLTVIFTLTIPSTIFGTFYGMNILLPGGLEAGPWIFWGPFTTFYIIVSVSVVSVILMLWYFKYKNWW